MNHERCPRAVWTLTTGGDGEGEWHCVGCGLLLALQLVGRGAGSYVHGALVPTKARHGDILAFGLPDRVRVNGRTARGAAFRPANVRYRGPVTLPAYVYCPRAGVCGRGQHVDLPE
jgi:hypothetical protein